MFWPDAQFPQAFQASLEKGMTVERAKEDQKLSAHLTARYFTVSDKTTGTKDQLVK